MGGNPLWSREKITEIAGNTGMSETQIYKWWWDQTRKRVKKLKIQKKTEENDNSNRVVVASEEATRDIEETQNSDDSILNNQN